MVNRQALKAEFTKELQLPDLSEFLERTNFPSAGTKACCAVSGGPDSTALAVLAKAGGLNLSLAYVDHGLRPDSHEDADFVNALAKSLGAEFISLKAVIPKGPNLEARARKGRYEALGKIDKNAMTGHTADDQAETILLNLLRGAGPEGLAGIRSDQRRPIIALRRKDTQKICELCGITPLLDPMNESLEIRRNRVRNEIIPLLNEVAERDIAPLLARNANLNRELTELMDRLTQDIDPTDAKALNNLDPTLAAWAIRRWLTTEHPPDLASVERVLSVARGEILATEIAGGIRVDRSQMKLRLQTPNLEHKLG